MATIDWKSYLVNKDTWKKTLLSEDNSYSWFFKSLGKIQPKYTKGSDLWNWVKGLNPNGVDFAIPFWTQIPSYEGKIIEVNDWTKMNSPWGKYVKVERLDKTIVQYSHLSSVDVKKGDSVINWQFIWSSWKSWNATWPHLDVSMWDSNWTQKSWEDVNKELSSPINSTLYTIPEDNQFWAWRDIQTIDDIYTLSSELNINLDTTDKDQIKSHINKWDIKWAVDLITKRKEELNKKSSEIDSLLEKYKTSSTIK